MEELLILVFQVIIEALLYFPWDILLYAREDSTRGSPGLLPWVVGSLGIGGLIGGLSLLFLPHVLLKWSVFRISTLIFSPVISGAVAGFFATKQRASKERVDARTHFWGAFCFTLGVVVVRFAFARR